MNSHTRTFLLVLLSILFILAAFAWTIDPYALFDTRRIEGVNRYKPVGLMHIRLSKAHRVNGNAYDLLILGSSRTGRGLNCSMVGGEATTCYNASSTAATPLESLRYLQQQKPSRVYLGLDLFTIVEKPLVNSSFVDERLRLNGDEKLNLSFFKQGITDYFGALISWQALGHSRLTLRSQDKARILPTADGMPYILADGSWGEDPERLINLGNNIRGKNQEKRFMHIYRVMSLMFNRSQKQHRESGQSVQDTMDTHLNAFREIVRYCHRNNIQLTVFFNAAHAYYWQLAYQKMERPVFDYWKRQVLDINQSVAGEYQRKAYPLHDFSGVNSVSIQDIPLASNGYRLADRFQDPMHYSREVGQQMIDLMAENCERQGERQGEGGWGVCLQRDNIDEHLAKQWQRYTTFSDQNRTEIARFRQRVMARPSKVR